MEELCIHQNFCKSPYFHILLLVNQALLSMVYLHLHLHPHLLVILGQHLSFGMALTPPHNQNNSKSIKVLSSFNILDFERIIKKGSMVHTSKLLQLELPNMLFPPFCPLVYFGRINLHLQSLQLHGLRLLENNGHFC